MTDAEVLTLTDCPLFRGIPGPELPGLLGCLGAREQRCGRGDLIWNVGDRVDACAVVLSGSLRAEHLTAAGDRVLMAYHGPGSLVGDVLMSTAEGRSPVCVTAAEPAVLLQLPFRRIMEGCGQCCERHTLLRINLLSEIADKFWAQRRRAEYLSVKSLRQKIAMRLWDEWQRCGSLTFTLGGTREDLADTLNANRSALSRELSRMIREGLIDSYRDSFRILDPDTLAALAGEAPPAQG